MNTWKQDASKIDKYVQEVISRTRKSSEILISPKPTKLRRWANPKETEIITSWRWVVHITREQIIGLMLWVLIPEEE